MNLPLVLLDSVAERGSGHTPSQKHPEYWNGGIKWVSLADSSALDRRYIYDTAKKISELGLRHSSATLHPRGTVILSRDAGVGKSAILGAEMAVSQHFIAWRCDGKRLCSEYLYQWLQYEKAEFERIATGSTVKTIGLGYFKKLRLPVPPIDVQKRIARALDAWDTAIQKTEKLITAKERRLAAVRQRFSVGNSRNGYVRVRLDSVLIETRELSCGNLPVYSVSVHKGLINQVEHLGRSFSAATTAHYNLVRPGDIVYTKSPTGDFPYGIVKQSSATENAAVSPLYGVYRPSNADIGLLVDFFFQSPVNAKNYLHPLVRKGAKSTIGIENAEFLRGVVAMPENPEQIALLSSFIREARGEIALLKKSVTALKSQKRGLMRKLITGQWRLHVQGKADR